MPFFVFFFHRCCFHRASHDTGQTERRDHIGAHRSPFSLEDRQRVLPLDSPFPPVQTLGHQKNENHHTGVKHRLKKGHKNETHVYEHLLNFFSEKKGWLTGRRRGCRVGLFVAAASVCRLCGLIRSVGFKKLFHHFFLLFLKSPITVTVASNKQGSGGYKTIVYLFKYCSNAIRLYRRCRK